MNKNLALTFAILMMACTPKAATTTAASGCYPSSGQSIIGSATNIVPITMGCGYVNEPCVAVKVCDNSSNCVTIDHILLDTGSYGLRLFNSTGCGIAGLNLTQQTGNISKTANTANGSPTLSSISSVTSLIAGQRISGTGIPAGTTITSVNGTSSVTMSNNATATNVGTTITFNGDVAECVHYADGTADWGPVKLANVTIAGQTASSIPIQIIDASYNSVPASCSGAESNPQDAGFNGILGVGLLVNDCPSCNGGSRTAGYYSCSSAGCTGYAALNNVQTINPISQLGALYNNGVVLSMNDVPSINGANGITGSMILGIDTVAGIPTPSGGSGGNSALGTTTFPASASLFFSTTFPSSGGHAFLNSFVDSGSNLWDFADDDMSQTIFVCSDGFYCPSSPLPLSVTPGGGNPFSFTLINADAADFTLTSYKTLGAYFDISNDSFDWGMPFYYNNNIFHLITGKTSTHMTGPGPAWAW